MADPVTSYVHLSNSTDQNASCSQVEVTDFVTEADHAGFRLKYRSNSYASTDAAAISDQEVSLPTVKILGTGGTIASKAKSAHATADYEVDLTIEELISQMPDLSGTCLLEYEQVLNIDSSQIDHKEVTMLRNQIVKDLPRYDGIVITHGTDTLEETAFYIQSTIDTDIPIVFSGSMRPSTAMSSDGPMNLYQAIVIAATRDSHGRGVLTSLNDRIGSGFYITKSNANTLDTFKSVGQGYIGTFVNNQVRFFFPPAKPLGMTLFQVAPNVELAKVHILYAHQGFDNEIIEQVLKNTKARGLVIATMGAGSLQSKTNALLASLVDPEFPIVYSKRSMDGMIPIGALPKVNGKPFENAVAGGYLNPQKARILLQLCLNAGYDLNKIKKVFSGV
ncbi:uncharacterized protein LODBEIA_P19940 [Lodderomyces beijingensis]|uniref:asparaginase n=1 Tax=Lodderomyces beijingensis TaxID=1775926 RepID=A0ABP0ZNC3_9ASCO